MTDEHTDRTPLEKLTAAVQTFVNEIDDDEAPILLRSCVVVWESNKLDDDGAAAYKVSYATTEGTGMGASVGLLRIGMHQILLDVEPD